MEIHFDKDNFLLLALANANRIVNNYNAYTEQELLALCQGRDERAFSEIYDRYWAVLYKHALRILKDKEAAQDVVQDTFISLWDRLDNLELHRSLNAYLYSTVRNKVLNCLQHGKTKDKHIAHFTQFIKTSEAITDYQVRERMLKDNIEHVVSHLPKKMRQIFEMSRTQELSYREIAEELNLSDKTVKKQVSNALKILRLKLNGFIAVTLIAYVHYLFLF